jgi:hypothetical protein
LRLPVAIGIAVLLSGCAGEPSEADLLQALRRYHRDWTTAQSRRVPSEAMPPLVNLSAEAGRSLHIHAVRKERCRRPKDEMGFVCIIDVTASTPFRLGVHRRIEARFVEGTRGWLAVAPTVLGTPDAGETARAPSG